MPARLRAKAPIVDEEHEVGALPVTALEQLHVAFVWWPMTDVAIQSELYGHTTRLTTSPKEGISDSGTLDRS